MIYSDLHIHSSYSDGILSPNEIIELSICKGIKCISITDHDSVQSQADFFNKTTEIKIVPGIELSSEYKGHEIHLLGYFINIDDSSLKNALDKIHAEREERVYSILDKLNKLSINVSVSEIEINKFVSLGRPHIAKLLIDKGYVNSMREAFHMYLAKGKPAYTERFKLSYREGLKLIKNCGGISALAHPGEIYKGINMERLIQDLRMYGLNGIEVFHPSHRDVDINRFYNFAIKYRLAITGGSDYHGSNSRSEASIGTRGLDSKLSVKFFDYYDKYIRGQK